MWIQVPATTVPPITQETVARLASIPHGTTIEAQGIIATVAGPPKRDLRTLSWRLGGVSHGNAS